MTQDNLTAKQNDYAVFLPAIHGFYATFVGKQLSCLPAGIQDIEQMNWLNSQQGLYDF